MELPWNGMLLAFMMFAAKEVLEINAGNTFVLYKKFLQVSGSNLAKHTTPNLHA
jgi:hypothetical protein